MTIQTMISMKIVGISFNILRVLLLGSVLGSAAARLMSGLHQTVATVKSMAVVSLA